MNGMLTAEMYARQADRCRMYGGTMAQIRYWQNKAVAAQQQEAHA